MTLKMLTLYPAACKTTTYRSPAGWSCLTLLDTSASHWDRAAYPEHPSVALVDGDSDHLLELAFAGAPKIGTVFKLHDNHTRSLVQRLPGCTRARTYLTYTTPPGYRPSSPSAATAELGELTSEAAELFSHNGYTREELAEHFARGATWFITTQDGHTVSACFVFQNYDRIWEVAGVYTLPEHRRKGYARTTVQAALTRLIDTGRLPRYQLRDENVASRAVAESLQMRCVLTVDHYVTARAPIRSGQGAA